MKSRDLKGDVMWGLFKSPLRDKFFRLNIWDWLCFNVEVGWGEWSNSATVCWLLWKRRSNSFLGKVEI